jgi:hypothetical protein
MLHHKRQRQHILLQAVQLLLRGRQRVTQHTLLLRGRRAAVAAGGCAWW